VTSFDHIESMSLRYYFGIIGICVDLIIYPLSVGPVARLALPSHAGGGLVAAPEWFSRAYRPLFTTVRRMPPWCSEAMMQYLRYWVPHRYASED
jgi:hypothetical protein